MSTTGKLVTDPGVKIRQLKEQRDTLKNTLWEIAELVGYKKGEQPNRGQLIARIKQRLEPYNATNKSPVASTAPVTVSPAPKPKPPVPPPPLKKKHAVTRLEFDITYARFGACMKSKGWDRLSKTFPPHINLKAGTYFLGDKNVAFRIVGYLATRPAFSVVVAPAWMLEDVKYVFKQGDLITYRTEWLLKRLGGADAARDIEKKRLQDHAARYGVFPQAMSNAGFKLEVANIMRVVRVVDINPAQHDRPVIIEEVIEHQPHLNPKPRRWNISTRRLNEARPDTISFAAVQAPGPVALKRGPQPASTSSEPQVPSYTQDSGNLAKALTEHIAATHEEVGDEDPFNTSYDDEPEAKKLKTE